MNPKIRIGIVEDNAEYRQSLVQKIEFMKNTCELDFAVGSYKEFKSKIAEYNPHVLLLDIELLDTDESDGIGILDLLKARQRNIKAVMVTSNDHDYLVKGSQKRGAQGFIVKSELSKRDAKFLEEKIIEVHRSNNFVVVRKGNLNDTSIPQLSSIDLEILRCLVEQGMTQNDIAIRRGKNVGTINSQVNDLRKAFKVQTTAQLITKVLSLNVLS